MPDRRQGGEDGDAVHAGPRADRARRRHMLLRRSGARYYVAGHGRPAGVAASPVGRRAVPLGRRKLPAPTRVGIIMTGMGDDGAPACWRCARPAPAPWRRTKRAAWCSACRRKRSSCGAADTKYCRFQKFPRDCAHDAGKGRCEKRHVLSTCIGCAASVSCEAECIPNAENNGLIVPIGSPFFCNPPTSATAISSSEMLLINVIRCGSARNLTIRNSHFVSEKARCKASFYYFILRNFIPYRKI